MQVAISNTLAQPRIAARASIADMLVAVVRARPKIDPPWGDEQLVLAARKGDHASQDELYRRYAQRALTVAVRLIANRADAEDIIHDSFALAFERIKSLREPDAFGRWLLGIVVNRSRRVLRRRTLLTRLGFASAAEIEIDTVAASTAPADIRIELQQTYDILAQWPINERLAWCLRQLAGMSLEEIGAVTGWSRATINRRLLAARQRLEIAERSRDA